MSQKGYVFKQGDWWWIRFFESRIETGTNGTRQLVRRQRATKLARVAPGHERLKRPPESVEALQREFVARVNQSDTQPELHITLDDFFKEVFAPHMASRRKRSTCYGQAMNWRRQLAPRIGSIRVRSFTTVAAQQALDSVARDQPNLARATLFRLKSLMSAVLRHAVNQGYCSAPNPVSLAEVPVGRASQETPYYLLDDVQAMLAILPETARTAVAVAAFAGLRRGEVEALRWEDVRATAISVSRSIWNGKEQEAKTSASKNLVPLIAPLRVILEAHRLRSGNPATGPLFLTRNGTHASLNNLLNDFILPTLRRCVHCGKPYDRPHVGHRYERDNSRPDWKGWHALRRGLATNLHDLGVSDLNIQRLLRHSNVSVTQRCYIKTLPEQSVSAMAKLENRLSTTIQ